MSDSPQTKKSSEEKSETKVQFKSDNIGSWASKQENPFAAQNRKTAAKRQEQDEQRKKAAPYVVVITSIIAVAVAVCGLVLLVIWLVNTSKSPDDLVIGGTGAEKITEEAEKIYLGQLENFYNQNNNNFGSVEDPSKDAERDATNAVIDYFDKQEESVKNDEEKIDLLLIEMRFYSYRGQPETTIKVAEGFDTSQMTNMQAQQFLGTLMNAYYSIGDIETGEEYANRLSEYADSGEANEGERNGDE